MMLYQSLYNQLKEQHELIEKIVSRVDPKKLTLIPAPGKWSIKDNVAHLAKYQPIFTERINSILKTESPGFERYKAENDSEFEAWQAMPVEELLQRLKKDRQHLFTLITGLNEQALSRIGVHPKFGKLTIIQWVEFFILHEAHHTFTIFQLANDVELNKTNK